jgi:hypothetical protein
MRAVKVNDESRMSSTEVGQGRGLVFRFVLVLELELEGTDRPTLLPPPYVPAKNMNLVAF